MTEISLGQSGQQHAVAVLRGCTGAAHCLADVVCRPGRLFAPFATEVTLERAMQFDVGGGASRTAAFKWLFEYLNSKPQGTLVIQDVWFTAADLAARQPNYDSYFFDENGVYYTLGLGSLSLENLCKLDREVKSFQSVGFFVATDLNSDFRAQSHRVTGHYFEQLANDAIAVFISAYDQESWIVWEAAT